MAHSGLGSGGGGTQIRNTFFLGWFVEVKLRYDSDPGCLVLCADMSWRIVSELYGSRMVGL